MTNQLSVLVRGSDDGEKIYAGGDLYRFLAKSGDTDGCYAIWEAIVPPGGGPPPHLLRPAAALASPRRRTCIARKRRAFM